MRGSAKARFGLSLVSLLAAFLAGPPATLPAAAQSSGPAASESHPPADAPAATRVQSFTTPVSPGAVQSTKVESLLGREVRTRNNDPGRIIDVLADSDGRVRAAVVELGGFLGIGTRKIAVDWTALRFDGGKKGQMVVLDMTREQLRLAQEYKPSQPVFVRAID